MQGGATSSTIFLRYNARDTDAPWERVVDRDVRRSGGARCSALQKRRAWDLRDVRHCIVSPSALLACDFLILELSAATGQSSSSSLSCARNVN